MTVDWSATGDMMAGIGAIVGAGAIIVAAWVGRTAISDYRNQKLANREIEAAKAVLTAAYRAQDAVEGVRGRYIPAGELQASEEQLKELGLSFDGMSDHEKSAYVQRGVIYRRAEFFKSEFDAVFEAIPAARAYFGSEVVESLKAFPRARNRILSSADLLPMMHNDHSADTELWKSIRADVYGISTDDGGDSLSNTISESILFLEGKLQSKLKPHG